MRHRNIKSRKVVDALKKFGCIIKRDTSHGVIVENPKNNKSINVPTHRETLAVWIYNNILRRLDIDKKEFTAKKIAEIKKISIDEVAKILVKNSKKLFKI